MVYILLLKIFSSFLHSSRVPDLVVVVNLYIILLRHKEAKDAGIITNVEFMKIYNDIIVNGVGGSGNNTSNSSSSSSSHHTPQPPSPPELNNKIYRRKLTIIEES